MRFRLSFVMLLSAVLLTAACGTGDDLGDDRASDATSTATPTTTPDESVTPTTPPPDPTTPPDEISMTPTKPGNITVSGVVEEGVESGCQLLQGYLLIVNDPEHQAVLASSPQVEVTGYVDESILSYCQQGKPLVVTSIRPLQA